MELTQEQVAWKAGMSRVYLSELERGLKEPSLTTILRLSRALTVSASEFVSAIEEEIASA
jgi:transcriptional regulator with XRE-family HTH domain